MPDLICTNAVTVRFTWSGNASEEVSCNKAASACFLSAILAFKTAIARSNASTLSLRSAIIAVFTSLSLSRCPEAALSAASSSVTFWLRPAIASLRVLMDDSSESISVERLSIVISLLAISLAFDACSSVHFCLKVEKPTSSSCFIFCAFDFMSVSSWMTFCTGVTSLPLIAAPASASAAQTAMARIISCMACKLSRESLRLFTSCYAARFVRGRLLSLKRATSQR
mmetsp:Transcript_168551/g.323942  ORF Transcript_168551/g.323942 Transcript_168551/m.323942 type:complete len:226 (+) Transcript_168551:1604-2281(+)